MTRSAKLLSKVPTRIASARSRERLTVRIPIAAEMLGIGRTKLYELIAEGEVDIIKIGKATLVTVRSLEALIERHCAARTSEPTDKRRRGRPRVSFIGLRG